MRTLLDSILKNAGNLDRLEKEFIKFTYETSSPTNDEELIEYLKKSFEISEKAHVLKNEIRTDLRDVDNIEIYDPKVIEVLDKVQRGGKFYSIAFYEMLAEKWNKIAETQSDKWNISTSDYLFYEKQDEIWDDFHGTYSAIEYYCAKIKIGSIVSSSKVPNNILSYFDELREIFAFGQYRASIALCRTLIEMSLSDKLQKRGAFRKGNQKITNINVAKESSLNRFIFLSKRSGIFSQKLADMAHQIRKQSNEILHAKNNALKPDEKLTFGIIFDTVILLEHLYR